VSELVLVPADRMDERRENQEQRSWMHARTCTAEQRLELLATIAEQCRDAAVGAAPGCAICLGAIGWMQLYRCFECGLWLCPACARKHFPDVRR
jgi:hypothetical protein